MNDRQREARHDPGGGAAGVKRRDFLRAPLAFGTAVTLAPRLDLVAPAAPPVPAPSPSPRIFSSVDVATPRLPILLDREAIPASYLQPGNSLVLKYELHQYAGAPVVKRARSEQVIWRPSRFSAFDVYLLPDRSLDLRPHDEPMGPRTWSMVPSYPARSVWSSLRP